MRIDVTFPDGLAVEAKVGDHHVRTDQPERHGGGDSAPPPFDLFLASVASCAGFYALRFCQQREIDTTDLAVSMDVHRDETGKRVERMTISVHLPEDFPEKYRPAILRSIDHCTVKRHILEPPVFDVEIAEQAAAAVA